MVTMGAMVAIIDDGKVLLTKREDFEVWCLPGGQTDPGESVAGTAVREAQEETGLIIELTRFVGVYSRLGGEQTIHLNLFAGRKVGGTLSPQVDEVLEIGYFAADALPEEMFWWHRQPIRDAVDGLQGVAWKLTVHPAQEVADRQALYALRDASGLSPVAFYRWYFESNGTEHALREV